MLGRVQQLGQFGLEYCRRVGVSGLFLLRIFLSPPKLKQAISLLIEQLHFVGVLSVVIIMFAGLFIGMVVALQGYNTLQRFGAEQQLGQDAPILAGCSPYRFYGHA